MNLNHIQVSMFENCVSTLGRTVAVFAIYQAIKQGRWREPVARIRHVYAAELKRSSSDHKKAKKAVEPLKKNLPAVTFSGIFSRRGNEYLQGHSGRIPLDIDAAALAGKDLNEVRAKLQTSPYVEAVFRSPSYGLKVIVRCRADASKHDGSFGAAKQHILDLTGVQIDESGKDLARLCFVSDDPSAYLNLNAQEITPLPGLQVLSSQTAQKTRQAEWDSKPSKEQICEMLRFIPKRPKYKPWITIVAAVGDALPVHDAVDVLNEWSPEEEQGEYAAKLKSGFTEIHIATLIYQAQHYGWKGPEKPYPSRNAEAARDFQEAIKNADTAKREASDTSPRIAKLKEPQEPVSFQQWRDVIEANFPALLKPAETCLSVLAQLLLNDVSNPFALALVDVPASGKTIILNFFDGPIELTYTTDNFTPASFVSHASNVKREELGNVDLLPRIRYRTLIVRELGSIFGAKDDDLIKSLGILTRVLDGEGLETDSGVHGRRGYKGDYLFMLLAGTPPIPPRVFKIMGNFGSRLFFLSLHTPDQDDDELIAQNKGTDRKLKERECKRATESFLRTLWATNPTGVTWNKADDPDDCLRVIARCSRLLAALRGAINVWHSDEGGEKLSHNVPVIEKPHRINCLLYNLARAHALICGRRQLTTDDLWPILDVTFDSAPTIRAKVFRKLIEAGGTLNTSAVVELLRCSEPTARKEMEALSVLGVVEKTAEGDGEPGRPETQITLASRFAWFGSDVCKLLMAGVTDIEGGNLFTIQSCEGIKKEFPPCACVKDPSGLKNAGSTTPAAAPIASYPSELTKPTKPTSSTSVSDDEDPEGETIL